MTVELLQKLSTYSYIAAAIFFLLAAALFFLLDIPGVIGILSGATARKGVEAIRRQNEEGGNKAHRASAVNSKRGKVTDQITHSGRIVTSVPNSMGVSVGTDELAGETTPIAPPESMETTDLSGYEAQMAVETPDFEETTDLSGYEAQAAAAAPAFEETTDLSGYESQPPIAAPTYEETTDLSAFAAQAPVAAPNYEETTDLSAFAQTQTPIPEETMDLSAFQNLHAAPAAPAAPMSDGITVDVEIGFTDSAEFIE